MPASMSRFAPPSRPARVVVADAHQLMRSTLRLLIETGEDLQVVGEAGSLPEAVQQARRLRAGVLVVDLSLLAGSGPAALAHLRDALPRTRIVAVTMEDSPGLARHALAGGASAFVVKDRADSELVDAVRSVARGERYVGPAIAAREGAGLAPGAR